MEKRPSYNKTYYTMNKKKMVKQIVDSRRSIINIDYIEANRARVIYELNNGIRKFIHLTTLRKYRINIDPLTLKYYHDDVVGESYLNKMD